MLRQYFPDSWIFHRRSCNVVEPVAGAGTASAHPAPPGDWKRYYGVPTLPLPVQDLPPVSLAETLSRRASCRRFAGGALPVGVLSAWLRSAFGAGAKYRFLEREMVERPLPSAGGCYPLELYLLVRAADQVAGGLHHYAPREHRLETLRGPLPWPAVRRLFMAQDGVDAAAVIVVLTAMLERTLGRYGDRGLRFVYMEAGHAAQNLHLAGEALELGTLALGGFDDDALSALLGLDPEVEVPLYGVAAGWPDSDDRWARRQLTAS